MANDKCLDVGMGMCFWCGESTSILINQKFKNCGDVGLKQNMFVGYDPCPTCEENWAKGCTVLEGSETPLEEGQPEIQKGVYPTGNHWVITKEAAQDIFQRDVPKIFIDEEVARKIGLYVEEPVDLATLGEENVEK